MHLEPWVWLWACFIFSFGVMLSVAVVLRHYARMSEMRFWQQFENGEDYMTDRPGRLIDLDGSPWVYHLDGKNRRTPRF